MAEMNIGMVGLDTSHCPAFTDLLNNPSNPHHVAGGRVRWAYPGGSKLFSKSFNRVEKFTSQLRDEFKVEILGSVEAVGEKADAVLMESVDGRQHLEQFKALAKLGKPVFIDKPLACSLDDAKAIMELSAKYNTPVYSASSIRYYKGIQGVAAGKTVVAVEAHGPVEILHDYPGYFWYGVHAAEVLFEILGEGCKTVRAIPSENADVITGLWEGNRVGILVGYRIAGTSDWGATVWAKEGIIQTKGDGSVPGYALLLPRVVEFFKTRKSPISTRQMLEVVAYLEALDKSRSSGEAVAIAI